MIIFLIGLFSGIMGGMGIGGGTLLIPALTFFTDLSQKQSQGINLTIFIPTATISLLFHFKNNNIETKIAIPIIISGLLGAFIGSTLAINLSNQNIKTAFALFLFIMGIFHIFYKK